MFLWKGKIHGMLYAKNQSRNVMEAAKNIAKAIYLCTAPPHLTLLTISPFSTFCEDRLHHLPTTTTTTCALHCLLVVQNTPRGQARMPRLCPPAPRSLCGRPRMKYRPGTERTSCDGLVGMANRMKLWHAS